MKQSARRLKPTLSLMAALVMAAAFLPAAPATQASLFASVPGGDTTGRQFTVNVLDDLGAADAAQVKAIKFTLYAEGEADIYGGAVIQAYEEADRMNVGTFAGKDGTVWGGRPTWNAEHAPGGGPELQTLTIDSGPASQIPTSHNGLFFPCVSSRAEITLDLMSKSGGMVLGNATITVLEYEYFSDHTAAVSLGKFAGYDPGDDDDDDDDDDDTDDDGSGDDNSGEPGDGDNGGHDHNGDGNEGSGGHDDDDSNDGDGGGSGSGGGNGDDSGSGDDSGGNDGDDEDGDATAAAAVTEETAVEAAGDIRFSREEFEALLDAGADLIIETPAGVIKLDFDALKAVFSVDKGDVVIRLLIADGGLVFDFSVSVNGKAVTDFGGGLVIIALFYELGADEDPNAILVWQIKEDGHRQIMRSYYDEDSKSVIFSFCSM